jgi:hypothetical protein
MVHATMGIRAPAKPISGEHWHLAARRSMPLATLHMARPR